ncbi:zinc ribbon domain-containing protein, partial [Calderihabitans maritimus]
CSGCGYVLPDIKLSTRYWVCPECGMYHDRDINAAQNLVNYLETA